MNMDIAGHYLVTYRHCIKAQTGSQSLNDVQESRKCFRFITVVPWSESDNKLISAASKCMQKKTMI